MAAKKTGKRTAAKKGGRPSKYEELVKPRLLEIEAWRRNGATDSEVAKALGIAESTLNLYKGKFSEFSEALKRSKEIADIQVENALFKKALGYNAAVKKTFKVKVVRYDPQTGKKVEEREELREVEDEVHIPADTTAQIYWLSNRMPENWRRQPDKEIQKDVQISVEFEDDGGELGE